MSTSQSDEKEGGKFVMTQVCNATKEELREEKYKLMDDCPACWSHGVKCLVADRRSHASTGK